MRLLAPPTFFCAVHLSCASAPSPQVDRAPDVTREPEPPAAPTPPATASPFVEVFRAQDVTRLHPLDDAMLVETAAKMVRVDGAEATDVTRWFTSVVDAAGGVDPREPGSTAWSISGRVEELRMRVRVPDTPAVIHRTFLRTGGTWSEQVPSERFRAVSHVSDVTLTNGAILFQSLEAGKIAFEVEGPKPALVPWLTKAKGCPSRLLYHATTRELEGGTIVGFGQACEGPNDKPPEGITPGWKISHVGKGPLAVETWTPGSSKAGFEVLPGRRTPDLINGAHFEVFGAPDDLWVSTAIEGRDQGRQWSGYVAHYDGKQWREVTPAHDEEITRFIKTPSGVAALGSRQAFLREGGSWSVIDLPRDAFLRDLVVVGDSVVAISEGTLLRWKMSERAFVPVALPEIDGRKTRASKLAVTKSRDAYVVAWNGAERPQVVLRWRDTL